MAELALDDAPFPGPLGPPNGGRPGAPAGGVIGPPGVSAGLPDGVRPGPLLDADALAAADVLLPALLGLPRGGTPGPAGEGAMPPTGRGAGPPGAPLWLVAELIVDDGPFPGPPGPPKEGATEPVGIGPMGPAGRGAGPPDGVGTGPPGRPPLLDADALALAEALLPEMMGAPGAPGRWPIRPAGERTGPPGKGAGPLFAESLLVDVAELTEPLGSPNEGAPGRPCGRPWERGPGPPRPPRETPTPPDMESPEAELVPEAKDPFGPTTPSPTPFDEGTLLPKPTEAEKSGLPVGKGEGNPGAPEGEAPE